MMRTMKRWLSLLLALLFVLSLGTVAAAEEADPVGIVADNVYYNEVLGIQMAPTDSWRFLSYAELAQRMNYDSQYASREGLQKLLKQDSYVTPMFAESTDGYGTNVNLVMTDLGIYKALDEQTFLSLAKDSMVEGLVGQGFTDVTTTEGTFQLAGKTHAGATVTCKLGVLEMYMIVILVKADSYMGSLTFASLDETKTKAAVDLFAPLGKMPAVVEAPKATAKPTPTAAPVNTTHDKIDKAIAKEDWAGALKLLDSKDGKSYPNHASVRQN